MHNHALTQAVSPKLVYVDRPEVSETCVDSVEKVIFQDGLVYIELVVNRLDMSLQPGITPTGKKCTACRLVLSAPAFMTLVSNLTLAVDGLGQQSLIRRSATPSPTGSSNQSI